MGSRTFRHDEDGLHVAGAINVASTAGSGEGAHVSSKQRVRIVQRNGETVTTEETESVERTTGKGGADDGRAKA
jgi:hypothetical protein